MQSPTLTTSGDAEMLSVLAPARPEPQTAACSASTRTAFSQDRNEDDSPDGPASQQRGVGRRKSYFATFSKLPKQVERYKSTFAIPKRQAQASLFVHKLYPMGIRVDPLVNISDSDLDNHNLDIGSDTFVCAQDLSPPLIEKLGTQYRLLPGVFEHHLHKSGYQGHYKDKDPHMWRAEHLEEICIPLRWFSVVSRRKLLKKYDVSATEENTSPADLTSQDMWPRLLGCKSVKGVNYSDGSIYDWSLRLQPNIFRRAWDLSPNNVNIAWEERATLSVRKHGAHRHDPLPTVLREERRYGNTTSPNRTNVLAVFDRPSTRRPPPAETLDWDGYLGSIEEFISEPPQSTYDDMQSWIRHREARGESTHPLVALFEVMRIDIEGLLTWLGIQLNESLHNEDSRIFDLQRHEIRRQSLVRALDELPKLRKCLDDYWNFLTKKQCFPAQSDDVSYLEREISRLDEDISGMHTRINAAKDIIQSEAALSESRKAITEARNVKRLTELAFFFIPMTFVAAVFSIQVKEFQEDPPPLWSFLVTASGLLLCVYYLRVIRHNTSIQSKGRIRAFLKDIWEEMMLTMPYYSNRLLVRLLRLLVRFIYTVFNRLTLVSQRTNRGAAENHISPEADTETTV